MAADGSNSPYCKSNLGRLSQGDILRDVVIYEWAGPTSADGSKEQEGDTDEVRYRLIPYVIVLTQECDLEQDLSNRRNDKRDNDDKFLQSILLAPAYLATDFKAGTHLEKDLKLRMQKFNSTNWPRVTKNHEYRYHRLPGELNLQIPELVIDFKHYCTLPRFVVDDEYMTQHYLASISPLFRENLSVRFAQYLSRIGLPETSEAAANST